MMPAYRNMDSYPFQRNQMPFPYYHHHSGIEAFPSQIRMDPPKSPFPYEQPWPYACNYEHPIPTHFCCGHNNFPGYYNYRPYPHAPAPSPMYYSGGYPAYGEPFFAPYPPQSHYTMELPRYEYDKQMLRDHHCCGCPNHSCNQTEGKNVRIEEHEADVGKKENDAMVPVQLRNYPYPLVWIPPEYYGNQQMKNSAAAEVGGKDKLFHDKKPIGPENFNADSQPGQEPRVLWNGWLPFDIKGTPNMVRDGEGIRSQKRETVNNRRETEDGRMDHKQESEHKRPEFPFPIIWLPYDNKQEEGGTTNNQKNNSIAECIEEVPHTLKSFPVNSHVDEGVTNRTKSNEVESKNTGASDVTEKVTSQRSIPVKQMDSHHGKNDLEGREKKEMNVPVNKKEENVTKEDSHSSSKRGLTSPRSASKLPPVCLRVDPLPRKKNCKGSSRSPSPPASKEHSQATAGETNKNPSSGMNDEAKPNSNPNIQNAPNISEKVTPKVKTIPVSENKTSENKGAECSDESQSQINMASGASTVTRESPTDCGQNRTEDKKEEKEAKNMTGEAVEHSVKDTSTPTDQGGKKEGRILLDADAAVLIQAAYRGYQVRKWEPLKKLKQIAEVSKEVSYVRSHIQAFEGSSDLQNDEKQKIAIGETIMRLLLKLDTIQGLHPSLREIRKSLARELVTLQEKLDSIMAKKPQQQMQEFDVQKPVEVTPLNMQNGEYHQEKQVAVPGDSSEDFSDGSPVDQFCMKDDDNNICPNDSGSESQSPVDPASKESKEGTEPKVLPNGIVNEDMSPMVAVDALDSTSNFSETEQTAVERNIPIEVDKQDTTVLEELPVGVIDEDITDVSSVKNKQIEGGMEDVLLSECTTTMMDRSLPATVDDSAHDALDSDINAMMELPVGLLDEHMATSEFRKDDETNISKGEVQAENEEFVMELPVELLDEDTAKSEFEKHDETKTHKAERDEYSANERTVSSIDDIAKETQLEQPLVEEQGEVQSSGESDGWIKIESQKDDELKGDAPLDIEDSGEGIGNDTKLPSVTTQVTCHDQGSEEVCLEANDVANILLESKELVEKQEEKLTQQETQVDGYDIVAGQAISADDKDTQTLAKEGTEQSADLAVVEHDAEMNGDMKLLEENEKLRKLMKELLEAGNEQLSVISNLTGRVKDLEKKLARSKRTKRVRTKRFKPLTSDMSSKSSE